MSLLNLRDSGGRTPPGAVRIDRRTRWGNPFRVDGDRAVWTAIAFGQRADKVGRRAAAVMAYRWWMTGGPLPVPTVSPGGGDFEYSDGTMCKVADVVVGMGLFMLSQFPLVLPPKPDLEPLRGKTLACWCAPEPCHGDVIAELLVRSPQPARVG